MCIIFLHLIFISVYHFYKRFISIYAIDSFFLSKKENNDIFIKQLVVAE